MAAALAITIVMDGWPAPSPLAVLCCAVLEGSEPCIRSPACLLEVSSTQSEPSAPTKGAKAR